MKHDAEEGRKDVPGGELLLALLGLPREDHAVDDCCAQSPVIRRGLSERAVSTLSSSFTTAVVRPQATLERKFAPCLFDQDKCD